MKNLSSHSDETLAAEARQAAELYNDFAKELQRRGYTLFRDGPYVQITKTERKSL
jgi:hypothetical protein